MCKTSLVAERLTNAQTRERTRARLLDAASRLYLERGFGVTSLDDIAREAGVTKGAVYAHFASKEDLLVALLEQAQPTLADISMFGGPGTFGAHVRTFGRAIAEQFTDDRAIALQAEYVSLAVRNNRARDVYGALVRDALTTLGNTVEAALASEPTTDFTGTDAVVVIDALLQGLLIRRAINPELVSDDLIENAISLLVSAFAIGITDPDEALKLLEQRRAAAEPPPGRPKRRR